MGLTGLSQINIELTSHCDKGCAFCGHQNPAFHPNLVRAHMELDLLRTIRDQIPPGTVVQFHRDGEPTLYPLLGHALLYFKAYLTSIVTHGGRLGEYDLAHQIIRQCTSLTVSVYENDPSWEFQHAAVSQFLLWKKDRAPLTQVKVVGMMSPKRIAVYEALGIPIIRRLLHVPRGSHDYRNGLPVRPEIGICLDFLHHPSVDVEGNLYICNRLDPLHKGLLGSLRKDSLESLWNSPLRQDWLAEHLRGRRDLVPLCATCEFWGVPSG